MKQLKIYIVGISVILVMAVVLLIVNQNKNVYGNNLMQGIKANEVEEVEISDEYASAVTDFSIELFKQAQTNGENSLISPYIIYSG